MLIEPRAPFNFVQTLRFILSPPALLNGRQFPPLLDYFVEGEYRRVLDFNGQLILYGVREEGGTENPGLRVRILAGPDHDRAKRTVALEVDRQFSTDLDLQPFHALARRDAVLRQLVAHFRGMRVPQAPRVFEILISAIIEQQVNLSFAHKVKKALIDAYGAAMEYEGCRYAAFPDPAALAVTTPGELLRLQVSGPKARYIIAISRLVRDGGLDLENLRQLEPALAHEKLLELKGVGHWTAQYVGLRALRAFGLPARRGRGIAESHPPFLRTPQKANPGACAKNGAGVARLAKLRHLLPVAHLLGERRVEGSGAARNPGARTIRVGPGSGGLYPKSQI